MVDVDTDDRHEGGEWKEEVEGESTDGACDGRSTCLEREGKEEKRTGRERWKKRERERRPVTVEDNERKRVQEWERVRGSARKSATRRWARKERGKDGWKRNGKEGSTRRSVSKHKEAFACAWWCVSPSHLGHEKGPWIPPTTNSPRPRSKGNPSYSNETSEPSSTQPLETHVFNTLPLSDPRGKSLQSKPLVSDPTRVDTYNSKARVRNRSSEEWKCVPVLQLHSALVVSMPLLDRLELGPKTARRARNEGNDSLILHQRYAREG